jgi:hypothetical protein
VITFEAESDPTLAREAAASQIKLLEALQHGDPNNEEVLLLLTRALASYAFGFLEMEAEKNVPARDRAAALYDRATQYGLLLLEKRLGKGTEQLAHSGVTDDWLARVSIAQKEDVEPLFWTGYAWAGAIRKKVNSPLAVSELPRAVALVDQVLRLDPNYHYGIAHIFMGVYFADRPPMLGGNPKRAREEFDAGLKVSDRKYVMGKYLMARYVAVATQDLPLFHKLLKEVIESPEDLLPPQRLSQEIARGWAKTLQSREKEFF